MAQRVSQRHQNPKRIGGYELQSKLGQGAMGAVFKARQESLDRIVALKVLPPKIAQDKQFIERFQREARASARLNHPNIVQGIDVGQDSATGLWYFAMEYIDGPTLKDVLKKEGPLDEQRVLEVGRDMAKALECAERHHIVHRDIKPDNILMTSRGEAKLADLGLAKNTASSEEDASLTQTGSAVGTPYYMAPEQARGDLDAVDIRSDIYALGATLYHLLLGKPPFDGPTAAVIMTKHLTDKVPLPHRENQEISEHTSRLVLRMMSKEQSQRVQTAEELVGQFEKLVDRSRSAVGRVGVRAASTTGPRSPIRPMGTTGPRSAIRAVGSTGPKAPIRGSTTGPHDAVGTRKGSPVALAAVVGLCLLCGGAWMMSGGSTPPKRPKRPVQKAPPKKVAKAPIESPPPKEDAKPDAPEVNPAQLASQAYEQLIRFDGLQPGDHEGRLNRISNFLSKHGETPAAAKARTLQSQVRQALEEAKKPKPPVPAPPQKKVVVVKPKPEVVEPKKKAPPPAQTDPLKWPPYRIYASVRDLLNELLPLVAKRRYDKAELLLDENLVSPKYKEVKPLVKAEKSDVTSVCALREEVVDALCKRKGEKVELHRGKLAFEGKIMPADGKGRVALRIKGGPELTLSASQLESQDVEKHAPREATPTPERLKRLGLLFLFERNTQKARSYFERARDAGLGPRSAYYLYRVKVLEVGEANASAERDWLAAESLFKAKQLKQAQKVYLDYRQKHAGTEFYKKNAELLKDRLETIEAAFKPKYVFRAEESMKLYPDGHRCGNFPVMEKADALGPFEGRPAYFDQRTGKQVVYEIRSPKKYSHLHWKGAAMRNMEMIIETLDGKVLAKSGPHQGGNRWAEFDLDFPPSRVFVLRLKNFVSHWYFINNLDFK